MSDHRTDTHVTIQSNNAVTIVIILTIQHKYVVIELILRKMLA